MTPVNGVTMPIDATERLARLLKEVFGYGVLSWENAARELLARGVTLPPDAAAGRRSAEPQPSGDNLANTSEPVGAVRENARTRSDGDFKTLAQAEPAALSAAPVEPSEAAVEPPQEPAP